MSKGTPSLRVYISVQHKNHLFLSPLKYRLTKIMKYYTVLLITEQILMQKLQNLNIPILLLGELRGKVTARCS